MELIGQTVSHYRIISKLGEGGMGAVYEAEDTKLNRRVALKFLAGSLGTSEERVRFVREAQAAAALDHPNICTVFEVDEFEGSTFISMALVRGHSLHDLVQEGPMPLDRALDLATQCADGLAAAHDRGIVHRDIKPANLMVAEDGRLSITDFGLAKLTDATQITRSSSTLGTPAYMAPEQVRGGDVDARADLWSVGVLLYELLSGRRPFRGANAQAMMFSILQSDPPSVNTVARDIPTELGWIVDRCLSKDPADRYASARELADDLRAVRAATSVGGGTTLRIQAGPRPRAGGRGRRIALVAIPILLAIAVYFIVQQFGDAAPDRPALVEEVAWNSPPKVVVLGFANQTGEAGLGAIATRATDLVSQRLYSTGAAEIVDLGDDFNGDGGDEVVLRARLSAADADLVVRGAYFLEGTNLKLGARVSDARTGELVFVVPDIGAMKNAPRDGLEQLAQRVAGGLAIRVDNPFRNPYEGVPPTYEAFAEYRLGLEYVLDNRLGQAMSQFTQAEQLDPAFLRPRIWKAWFVLASTRDASIVSALDSLRPRLDEWERLAVDAMLAGMERNFEKQLGLYTRIHETWPEDINGGLLLMNTLRDLNRPRQALQVYEDLAIPVELRRREFIAVNNLREVGDLFHAVGDYEGELRFRQELVGDCPNSPFLHMDLCWPYAALGELDEVKDIVAQSIGLSSVSQGELDWNVWTTCGIFRAHGHEPEAKELARWFIDQRLGISRPGKDEEAAGFEFLKNNHAMLLIHAGELEQARALLIEAKAEGVQPEVVPLMLAVVDAMEGDAEAVAELEEARWAQNPGPGRDPFLWMARYDALLGNFEQSVQHLREAGARGHPLNHRRLVHDSPGLLYPLVGYEPFEELIAPQG